MNDPKRLVPVVLRVTFDLELTDPTDPETQKLTDGEIAAAGKEAVENALAYFSVADGDVTLAGKPKVEFARGPDPAGKLHILAQVRGGVLDSVRVSPQPGVTPELVVIDWDSVEAGDPPAVDEAEYTTQHKLKELM